MMGESSPAPTEVGPQAAVEATAWCRALLPVLFALLWILAWYGSTGAAMARIWARSATFAHGFVVPPIALWLVWRARAQLAAVAPRPSWWVLGLLSLAGFGWLLGELAAVNSVSQLAFTALLVLTVPAVLGTQAARAIAFPLAFLFFAVPIGEFLLPQFMESTAQFTVLALKLTGVPVYREGLQFVIPSGQWSVVEACSGVRYLIASVMVGTLYAYLNYRSALRRVVFVAFSVFVPIIANWLRAYMIVMLGHLSGNRLATGIDHLIYGWVFFGVVMVLMFWIGARWREDHLPPVTGPEASAVPTQSASSSRVWLGAMAVAAVALIWQVTYRAIERSDAGSSPRLAPIAAVGDWQAALGGLTDWKPQFQNASGELYQTFRRGNQTVGMYIGYYRNQSYERKLVSSDNGLVKSNEHSWANVTSDSRQISFADRPLSVKRAQLRGSGGERLIAWQWYWINGRLTASDHWAKGYTALSRLYGKGDDSAVVVVYARDDFPGGAEAVLDSFLHDAAPVIDTALRKTRDAR